MTNLLTHALLCAHPEPGYEKSMHTDQGRQQSINYNKVCTVELGSWFQSVCVWGG